MNNYPIGLLSTESSYLLGIGSKASFEVGKSFESDLDLFINKHKGLYIFSCLTYDLKNRFEDLKSEHIDFVQFPELLFWVPETVVEITESDINVVQGVWSEAVAEIVAQFQSSFEEYSLPNLDFKSLITKEIYLEKVNAIKQEIQLGNCYELNFCQQYVAKEVPEFNAYAMFYKLKELTQAPFSAFLDLGTHQVFCGSPERFIKKENFKITSQPIKGTSRRGKTEEEDLILIEALRNNPKERAENVMITDLVRNDLSRIAQKNSVQVEELCGIYTFGTVHQMISTISCEMRPDTSFSEILKATFPMGSMTGAPKIKTMELIEKYESFKRGLYSGSIGYIAPNGDFDFNVVIRTLILNKSTQTMTAAVGGAITIKSDAESEFEECQVKIKKLLQLFSND